eukprot:CAMPEP_0197489382 /NCGR_PEP_ID=MMETSP1311-20131121/4176_1 /TAXON_ID=464262 /ORGANISM="Genus nov. species nov., Strain RCC856" /LENGTH=483 /DNA_ID=CAMNT_0043033683 /DNA_START=116 /DNA_END=1567 /DNA_ORIENTATION=-
MRLATPKVFANCLAFVLVALLFYYVVFSSYLLLDMSKASVGRGGSNKSAATLSDLRFVPIVMKDADDLTPLDLYGEHGREPVIIKGALKAHPFMREGRNTPDHFAQVCGDALIDTVVYDSNYTGWAGHKDEILMTVRDFVDGYMVKEGRESSPHPEELRYAHSNSYGMPQLCPALQWEVLIPRHASIDLPTAGSRRNLGQPTLFMGPTGSRSELHMDMYLLPFWLSVYFGQKSFRVILFEDSAAHFEGDFMRTGRHRKVVTDAATGEERVVSLEIWDPDVEIFPELANVRIYEGEVNAGDVIYVPSGALHGILNTEQSFGATSNALFAPLPSHYTEVCVKANFANGCKDALDLTYRGECESERLDPLDLGTASDFAKCAINSKTAEEFGRDAYTANAGFHDKYLYEAHGFGSYAEWCQATCANINESFLEHEREQMLDVKADGKVRRETAAKREKRMLKLAEREHNDKAQFVVCNKQCSATPT